MRLSGKTAIITGGSSGIGRAIAILFAKEGANVVIGDIRTDPREGGEATEQVIAEVGGTCRFRRCDVSRWDDVDDLVTRSVAEFGKLDVMVNNAATFVGKKILETTEEDWDYVMGTNAKGVFFGCKRAIQQMLTQEVVGDARGRIVNISSQHGMVCAPAKFAYGVGKASAVYMTRQIAVDYAEDNIISATRSRRAEFSPASRWTARERIRSSTPTCAPRCPASAARATSHTPRCFSRATRRPTSPATT